MVEQMKVDVAPQEILHQYVVEQMVIPMLTMLQVMLQTLNVHLVHQVLPTSLINDDQCHEHVQRQMVDLQYRVQLLEHYHQYVALQIKPIQMVVQTMDQIHSVILDLLHQQHLHSQQLVKQ